MTSKTTRFKRDQNTDLIETYLSPPPPKNGKIIGLDCHPDTFTAAVMAGQTPHDARKISSRDQLSLPALLAWAKENFSAQDLFVLEAGSNSFAGCEALSRLGRHAIVLESARVREHAK